MTPTLNVFAQQLWDAACYDEDGDIPVTVFLDMCKDAGIELVTPDVDTRCGICGKPATACNCDRAYERWAGK